MVKNVLRRKLVRDMWHNRMQFLAVILLCALGTWVFSGLDAAWRMLDLSAQTYFDEQNVADIWITLSSADREAVERVRGIAGVEDVQARGTAELTVDLPHEPSLVVEAYDGTARWCARGATCRAATCAAACSMSCLPGKTGWPWATASA